MGDSDQYHRQADDARQLAAKSVCPDDKDFWLRMAED
jgi:hypothetical protein